MNGNKGSPKNRTGWDKWKEKRKKEVCGKEENEKNSGGWLGMQSDKVMEVSTEKFQKLIPQHGAT